MSLSRLFHSYRDEPIGRWARNFLAVYSGNIRKSPTHHVESIDSAFEPSIQFRGEG